MHMSVLIERKEFVLKEDGRCTTPEHFFFH